MLGIQTELGDRAPGRIGDGTIEWNVPMAQLKTVALSSDDTGFVLRFPSSYVYVKASAAVQANIPAGGTVVVSLSDNNGLDWKEVATLDKTGEQTIHLTKFVQRRYEYRLKFDLRGQGAKVDSIKTVNDFQCSQAALPTITEGENKITFAAGANEGTVTVEGSTETQLATKNGQLTVGDFHPVFSGAMQENLHMKGASGDATFNVVTPGDMTRVRISGAYRTRDPKDSFDVQVSYDGGKTFKSAGKFDGGGKGASRYIVVKDVPAGVKAAQVKLVGRQKSTALIFDLRIDADYKEPAGGFKPVKITYTWDEGGQIKSDVPFARTPHETYSITCPPGAIVKRYAMELAE